MTHSSKLPRSKYRGKNKPKLQQAPLVILSNERSPAKAEMLQMFYNAAKMGQIGLVDGMDPDTGEILPMLAGIAMKDGELTGVFPLATLMQDINQIARILIPDGQGNYVSTNSNLAESDNGSPEPEAEAEGGEAVEQGQAEDSERSELAGGNDSPV